MNEGTATIPTESTSYPWRPRPRISLTAVAALVTALYALPVISIILGYLALGRIRDSQGRLLGRGLAMFGVIFGWIAIVVWIIAGIVIAVNA